MIPSKFPVTMIADDGHEYEVHTPAAYVTAVFSQGHRPKAAAPRPAAPTPEPAAEPKPAAPIRGMTVSTVAVDEAASTLTPRIKSDSILINKEEGK